MKLLITLIFSIITALSAPAFAGAGHDHGLISQTDAEKIAVNIVGNLANKQKIDASWEGSTVDSAEQKKFSGEIEWVVTFKNDKATDVDKETLYIFLTLDGRFVAANYTGN